MILEKKITKRGLSVKVENTKLELLRRVCLTALYVEVVSECFFLVQSFFFRSTVYIIFTPGRKPGTKIAGDTMS